jgi:hypothetical protein
LLNLHYLLFLAAGDWRWQQSWVFLGELGLSSFAVSFWLLRHDPALLESRLTTPVCPEVLRA